MQAQLVYFGCLMNLGQELRQRVTPSDVMVFTSPWIGKLYYNQLKSGLERAGFHQIQRHDIPDGEEYKNIGEWRRAIDALTDFFSSSVTPLVINLGGGVVGDLGGFAAGTYRLGMIIATQLGIELGTCNERVLKRLQELIIRAGLHVSTDATIEPNQVLQIMQRDKKFVNGVNRFVLPVEIGQGCVKEDVSEMLVRDVVESCIHERLI